MVLNYLNKVEGDKGMSADFLIKAVGYQDKKLKKELSRVVHLQMGTTPISDWLAVIARVLSIALTAVFAVLTILFMIGSKTVKIDSANVYIIVLITISLSSLLVTFGIRRKSDPLTENLWPSESLVLEISFFPEFFQVGETHFCFQVYYSAVRSVFESDAAFYLFVRDRHVLMLRKREFVQGDPEQFRSFIIEKTKKSIVYI